MRLFLGGLLGGLGDLSGALVALGDLLDDTDGNCLPHVADSESAQGWVVSEALNTHRLGRNHLDDGSITSYGRSQSWPISTVGSKAYI